MPQTDGFLYILYSMKRKGQCMHFFSARKPNRMVLRAVQSSFVMGGFEDKQTSNKDQESLKIPVV